MDMYTATIELNHPADTVPDGLGDQLLDHYTNHHPVITRSVLGRAELIISLPAETLAQAVTTTMALTAGLPITRLIVETSADADLRSEAEVPGLMSITEAATALGLTRAGVQRRIDAGTLPAIKVGAVWVLPTSGIKPPSQDR